MKITTADEMRTIDRVTSEKHGVHSLALMENAGTAVANFAREHLPEAHRISILCGKGNNGGDGFVAARKLHQAQKVVEVLLLGDPAELKGDAANMYARLPFRAVIVRSEQDLTNELSRGLGNAELIIDAVLGTGVRLPVTGLAARAIDVLNKTTAPVLAVDLPSGADADSMTFQKGPIARADAIVTFTAPRPAHIFSALTRGPIVVASIGSPDEAIASKLNLEVITAREVAPLLALRAVDANKGSFGHALIVGGSAGKAGAAAMAGMAALRSGAGLATVATARTVLNTVAGFAAELMTEAFPETEAGSIAPTALDNGRFEQVSHGKNVIAIGPGISRDPGTERFVRMAVAKAKGPLVLDADALNAFEGKSEELKKAPRPLVITPHPGEMARLTGLNTKQIQQDRLGTARKFAAENRCTVVLKGYRTIVASPTGSTWVNPTGNAGMATGGTGDILTGMIAGLIAQFPTRIDEAVRAAVYLHGLAGDLARGTQEEQSLIATDLLTFLPAAIRQARGSAKSKLTRIG